MQTVKRDDVVKNTGRVPRMAPMGSGCATWPARVLTRILLVEDDRRTHQIMQKILIHEGCNVISALTQAAGLDRLDKDLDCVILDLSLPDGDGEVILRKIRSERLAV